MESYRASRSKRVRTSLVFGGFLALSFLAEADGLIWGLRLVLAVLLGGQLYGHVYGYPRLTWTQEEIRFTGRLWQETAVALVRSRAGAGL